MYLRLPRIVVEREANLADGDLEHGVADEHARPRRIEQVVLRDEAAAPLGEVPEHTERLGREGHLAGADPDALVGEVDDEPGCRRLGASCRQVGPDGADHVQGKS